MPKLEMPNTAQEWAQLLVSKQLPSPFRIGQLVLRKMEDGNLPYAKLADLINNDPILSYSIMSLANKERATGSASSKTISHAISMIGVEQLTETIKSLPFQKSSSTDLKSFYYTRVMSSSLYAAHLGKAISIFKAKANPEDIYWSSLFLGVPLWYLWRYATPEMRLIRYAIRSNFKLPQVAEKEVLGDSLADVCTAISDQLFLPDLATECFKKESQLSNKQWVKLAQATDQKGMPRRIEDRSLLMSMQSPVFIVMLANLVSHFATYDWYSRATLRSQKILATYLQVPLDDAIKLTHEVAASMSRTHPLPGVMLPAAKLLVPPRKRTRAHAKPKELPERELTPEEGTITLGDQPALTKQQTDILSQQNGPDLPEESEPAENQTLADRAGHSEDQPETAIEQNQDETTMVNVAAIIAKTENQQPENTGNQQLFDELTDIMTNQPEEFVDLHELMNAATQGIAYGINLKRVTVALISRDLSRLKNYYSVGCQDSETLKGFETKIVKDTIFDKLTLRPASIWVKSSSAKKITDLIPMNFSHAADERDFFLMSVFIGKKPVAVFYADNAKGQTLTEDHYNKFKYMCGAVSNALQHQAKK